MKYNVEMGRVLLSSEDIPLLKIGVTLAIFHSSGTIPVVIAALKISVIDAVMISALILISLLEILSRPVDSYETSCNIV